MRAMRANPHPARSGGGSLGAFHLGVVKALLEHHMLPRVLAGSSVGSIGEEQQRGMQDCILFC